MKEVIEVSLVEVDVNIDVFYTYDETRTETEDCRGTVDKKGVVDCGSA